MLIINLLLLLINKSYIKLTNHYSITLYFIFYSLQLLIQYTINKYKYTLQLFIPTSNLTYPPLLQPPLILSLCNSKQAIKKTGIP